MARNGKREERHPVTFRRVMSLVLALIMTVSLMNVSILAAEYQNEYPTVTVKVGETVQLDGSDSDTADSWSVDEAGLEVASVDEDGVVTGLAEGEALVTHTYYTAETVAAPVVEPPVEEIPAEEVPKAETPVTEDPAAETPATEVPETPAAEAPAAETPTEDIPAEEVPAAEAPAAETPAAAPSTEEAPAAGEVVGTASAIVNDAAPEETAETVEYTAHSEQFRVVVEPAGKLAPVDMITGTATYDGVTVDVSAPVSAFPEGTTLTITPIEPEKTGLAAVAEGIADALTGAEETALPTLENVSEAISQVVPMEEDDAAPVAFDITFTDAEGVEVQPVGDTVSVVFTAAEDSALAGNDLSVFHVAADAESAEEETPVLKAEVQEAQTTVGETESVAEVEAETFSIYAVTVKKGDTVIGTYNVKPGATFDIQGTRYYGHKWSVKSGSDVVQITSFENSLATLKALKTGTAIVEHKYGKAKWTTETFTVIVSNGVEIKDTVKTDGLLTASAEGENLSYAWYKGASESTCTTPITSAKVSGDIRNVAQDAKAASALNIAADKSLDEKQGANYTWYKVVVTDASGKEIGSATAEVDYNVSLQNGGFEQPTCSDKNACNVMNQTGVPSWSTTASDGKIEIGRAADRSAEDVFNIYGIGTRTLIKEHVYFDDEYSYALNGDGDAESASGTAQFAELNANEASSLYQSVLSLPHADLNWQLSHRARLRDDELNNGAKKKDVKDTMYVVIMSDADATALLNAAGSDQQSVLQNMAERVADTGKQETYSYKKASYTVQAWKLTSDATGWQSHSGSYTVPDGQYMTRFFFVSGDTYYDKHGDGDAKANTVGNLLDSVFFSALPLPPTADKGNLTVTKTVTGLDDLENLPAGYAVKVTVNGEEQTITDFDKVGTSFVGSTTFRNLVPGSYTVNEAAVPAVDGYTSPAAASDTETVQEGQTANATLTNAYTKLATYTVTYLKADGSTLQTKSDYHLGDSVTIPAGPAKQADNTYTYAFTGWKLKTGTELADGKCAGDAIYEPTYQSAAINYTVTYLKADGSTLQTKNDYHFGDSVTIPAGPTKQDNTYTYTFTGWKLKTGTELAAGKCAGDATYEPTYKRTAIDYTVTYLDESGKQLQSKTYHYGDTVTAPTAPIKSADNTYTYSFKEWTLQAGTALNAGKCAGNATYKAAYTPKYIDYTVTYLKADGSTLTSGTYHFGDPVTIPDGPSKTADDTNIYDFTGWTLKTGKELVGGKCAGNATYEPTYQSTAIDYTVQYLDEDGTQIQSETYHYGATVTAPADPIKGADDTYTYTFAGWALQAGTALNAGKCAGNATYKATYNSVYRTYTVTYLDAVGGTLQTRNDYHFGDSVTIPAGPTKQADDTYTYTFKEWKLQEGGVALADGKCAGNATYEPVYDRAFIEYTVTFIIDGDYFTKTLGTANYHFGQEVQMMTPETHDGYTFSGWTSADLGAENIMPAKNATVKGHYNAIDYTVAYDLNGGVSTTAQLSYTKHMDDATPTIAQPTMAADATYTYKFAGWLSSADSKTYANNALPATVTGSVTYTAQWTPNYNNYIVTYAAGTAGKFVDQVFSEQHYNDATPAFTGDLSNHTPGYTFTGWNDGKTTYAAGTALPAKVTGNVTYTAQWTQDQYTVTYTKGEHGTFEDQSTGSLTYGVATPTYTGEKTHEAGWTFAGWNDGKTTYGVNATLPTVSGNVTYTAQWTQDQYTVTYTKGEHGTFEDQSTGSLIYDANTPAFTGELSHELGWTFAGWNDGTTTYAAGAALPAKVTGNVTYTAQWTQDQYTVTYLDAVGGTLQTKSDYHYGDPVTAPAENPSKASDGTYTYGFAGWSLKEGSALVDGKCAGNAIYKPTYEGTYINYTVAYALNGGVSATAQLSYTKHMGDATPTVAQPTRSADSTYTYEFAGWLSSADGQIYKTNAALPATVTGSVTYTAQWTSSYRHYTVTYTKGEHGTFEDQSTGSLIYDATTPAFTGETTHNPGYTFAGWLSSADDKTYANDALPAKVSGNVTYTAQWTQDQYTVTYTKGDHGTFEDQSTGSLIYDAATPAFDGETTHELGYTFAGWNDGKTTYAAGAALPAKVSGNVTYTAQWTQDQYTVTYLDAVGGTLQTKSDYHYGDPVTAPAENPSKASDGTYTYGFAGWELKEGSALVDGKCTGNAIYKPTYEGTYISYTVAYALNGGVSATAQLSYSKHMGDATPTVAQPTRSADSTYTYEFAGWLSSADGQTYANDALPAKVSGSVTYTAQWTPSYRHYTVTYTKGDHGTFEDQSTGSLIYDATTPAFDGETTHELGWTFAGWNDGKTTYAAGAALPAKVSGSVTYTAQWTQDQYTVTYAKGNHGTFDAQTTGSLIYGTATPAFTGELSHEADWRFAGWLSSADGQTYESNAALPATVSGSVTYTAQWTPTDTGYGPGENPLEQIPDEQTPTTDLPETVIPEEQVPTTETPVEEITEIEEPAVPEAAQPTKTVKPSKTGDALMLWIAAAGASGIGLAYLALTGRKRREDAE
jgi:uncharacterized repeat protein (TIGR02543 family)